MTTFPSTEAPGRTDYRELAERMGADVLRRRIEKQAGLWARETHQGQGILKIERYLPVDFLIEKCIQLCGFGGWGRRNFLDLQIIHRELKLSSLPPEFEGFRLLQLTDLHCDLLPELMDVVLERLKGITYDAVALTGDYHNTIGGNSDLSLDLMGRLLAALARPCVATLGNHDFIEKVAFLESWGVQVLLNEAVSLERNGRRLWLCGVDDAHYFQTHDLRRARHSVPVKEPAILLSHSPEPYREAAALGYQAMLCGHTHGGQICLPGGTSIIRNIVGPGFLIAGEWSHEGLTGYTSRGTGGCGVAVRFFCPPEITIHTLRTAK